MNIFKISSLLIIVLFMSTSLKAQQPKSMEAIMISYSDVKAEVRINDLYFKELKDGSYTSSGPITIFLVPGENTIEFRNVSIVDEASFFLKIGVYRTPVGEFVDEGEKLTEFNTESVSDIKNKIITLTFMVPETFKTPLQELEPLTKDDQAAVKKLATRMYKTISKNKLTNANAEDISFFFKLLDSVYPPKPDSNTAEDFINEMIGEDETFIGNMDGLNFKPYFNGKLLQVLNKDNRHIIKSESNGTKDKSITETVLYIGKHKGKVQICFVDFLTEYLE